MFKYSFLGIGMILQKRL